MGKKNLIPTSSRLLGECFNQLEDVGPEVEVASHVHSQASSRRQRFSLGWFSNAQRTIKLTVHITFSSRCNHQKVTTVGAFDCAFIKMELGEFAAQTHLPIRHCKGNGSVMERFCHQTNRERATRKPEAEACWIAPEASYQSVFEQYHRRDKRNNTDSSSPKVTK